MGLALLVGPGAAQTGARAAGAPHIASRPVIGACALSAADRAWVSRAVDGWLAARRVLLREPAPDRFDATIFDETCRIDSDAAMVSGGDDWVATPIAGGTITIAGKPQQVGVFSATLPEGAASAGAGGAASARFWMSTPSVWAAHQVPPGPLGLRTLMMAVMVHEATRVFQTGTYGARIDALQRARHLSDDDFNNDAIQDHFGKDADFVQSVARETDLFFAAAQARDPATAQLLARGARAMMKARAAKYYIGGQAYQTQAEELWLTMEGSAQWAGYRWLLLPVAQGGAGATAATADAGFGRRGTHWTQLEGLAIALTVERLGPDGWRHDLFGEGRRTLLELLDAGLEQG